MSHVVTVHEDAFYGLGQLAPAPVFVKDAVERKVGTEPGLFDDGGPIFDEDGSVRPVAVGVGAAILAVTIGLAFWIRKRREEG